MYVTCIVQAGLVKHSAPLSFSIAVSIGFIAYNLMTVAMLNQGWLGLQVYSGELEMEI